jgi:hypothetical protein
VRVPTRGKGGGPTRSSFEVSIMRMGRRGWIIKLYCLANQQWEQIGDKAKFARSGDGMIRAG